MHWQYEYNTIYKCCMCGCSDIDSCMIYIKMLFFLMKMYYHDTCVLTILYYFVYFYETLDVQRQYCLILCIFMKF